MEDNQKEDSSKEATIEFKKPVLIGRIGKLPKKAKSEPEKVPEPPKVVKPEKEDDNVEKSHAKSSLPPAVLLKELSCPIPYKEPKWSGLCPDGSDYGLEVLKSGMIVEKIDLTNKPFYVFGRLANSDVIMAHPTISRHHAVLQYKAVADEGEPSSGWYLYDLDSTHGTFLNKERLKPGHYCRARVGHQIKFGTSTRTYIVLGPDFDCEGESDLTVTEIKQRAQVMKMDRDRTMQEAMEQRERDREEAERRRVEQGIDWGMGEDAEEEPDLAENPYASTGNEELYLEDPKKTLRGYFEREGHELKYDCDERGPGQFLCRVELPMDDARGRPMIAEVIHKGKKKEAVIACALEACRILDRAGLLRQAKHESRRRKERDWSADDYYDSDDDSYLDRTGAVERKRRMRMRRHGARAAGGPDVAGRGPGPLTHDDLLKQISQLETSLSSEEKILEDLRSSKPEAGGSEMDDLDAYMSTLGRQGQSMAHKAEISKTKMSIQKLKLKLAKTRRLAEIARPAHLPPLIKKDSKMAVKQANSVIYGKRIKLKEDTQRQKKERKEVKQEESEFVEEVDSDENNSDDCTGQETTNRGKTTQEKVSRSTESPSGSEKDASSETSTSDKDTNKPKRVFGPMRPPDNYVIPESYFDQESDRDMPNMEEKDSL